MHYRPEHQPSPALTGAKICNASITRTYFRDITNFYGQVAGMDSNTWASGAKIMYRFLPAAMEWQATDVRTRIYRETFPAMNRSTTTVRLTINGTRAF
jgi:hypothetical protein